MTEPGEVVRAAVVLAGGASRRFGRDKLSADLAGRSLLDTVIAGLPDEIDVIVVGPPRPLSRSVHWIREEPPGGGPTAALITGLRRALAGPAEIVWVLPGDTPDAGAAARELDRALRLGSDQARGPGRDRAADTLGESVAAVVAVDTDGQAQPLQLALRRSAARQLLDLAGPDAGHNASARRLISTMTPPPVPCPVAPSGYADIDTEEQLRRWSAQQKPRGGDLRNDDRA